MPQSIRRIFSARERKRLAKDRNGTIVIEFGLIALPFFILIFGLFDVGLAHMTNRMFDNAIIDTTRLIRTGQAHSSGLDAAGFKTQICDSMPDFLCFEDRITVECESVSAFNQVSSISSLYDDDGNLRNDTGYDIGAAQEIVACKAIYRWPMVSAILNFDDGDYGNERHLTSMMVFRNEPWE